jgi:hypothetical protein
LRHVGQHFILNIDLKNFFPSIRTHEVISALSSIKTPCLVSVTPNPGVKDQERTPLWPEKSIGASATAVQFAWTSDVAILVAKLATHRGRLPQGAPTSPAIASLVFRAYDERIIKALPKGVRYTRYVDDLTFSCSSRIAEQKRWDEPGGFRDEIVSVVEGVLRTSAFRINRGKIRVSKPHARFTVTGVQVTDAGIDLRRKTKREIRRLEHLIRRYGLANTAGDRFDDVDLLSDLRMGDGVSELNLRGRRIAIHHLAGALIRRLHSDLVVETRSHSGEQALARGLPPEKWDCYSGKQAIQLACRVLHYVWQDRLAVTQTDTDDPHLEFSDSRGELICRVRSVAGELGLFTLHRDKAVRTILLWHKICGLAAALNLRDRDRKFEKIRAWHSKLINLLASVRVPIDATGLGKTSADAEPVVSASINSSDAFAVRMSNLLRHAREALGLEVARSDHRVRVFCALVELPEDFQSWINAVCELLVELPAKLPRAAAGTRDWREALNLVRILRDVVTGTRHSDYDAVQPVISRYRLLESPSLRRAQSAQGALVRRLEEGLDALAGSEAYEAPSVEDNPCRKAMKERLAEEVAILERELRIYMSSTYCLFDIVAPEDIAPIQRKARALTELPENSRTDECWKALLELCLAVSSVVFEPYRWKEGTDGRSGKRDDAIAVHAAGIARGEKRSVSALFALNKMRDVGAHLFGRNKELSIQTWNSVLRWTAKKSGREKPQPLVQNDLTKPHPYSVLPLRPIEAQEAAIILISELREELSKLATTFQGERPARELMHNAGRPDRPDDVDRGA